MTDYRRQLIEHDNGLILDRHGGWLKLHATLPVVWGAWLTVAQSYQSSDTYDVAASLGDEWVLGLLVLASGLICHAVLWATRNRREAQLIAYLILAMTFGGICGLFLAGNWRSTGVPVYGFLTIGHLFAYREVLRDTQEEGAWQTAQQAQH